MVKEYILSMKIVFTQEIEKSTQYSFETLNYIEDGLKKPLAIIGMMGN